MEELKLTFPKKETQSRIFFGKNLLPAIPGFVREHFPNRRIVVISDRKVAKLYGKGLNRTFSKAGLRSELVSFPEGESSKSRGVKARLENKLFSLGFGRDSLAVACGGGVTGDLAGFIAATFCRGIPYLQVPTTVLAMADSSVGGKTGIDAPAGKNLIGAFHQPGAVFMDPSVLSTLSERQVRAGLVEIIKHALIRDRALFEDLSSHLPELSAPAKHCELFNRILFRSCSIKSEVVIADETEGGWRQILNFGHTMGHALEALSEFKLLHGEAVSVGIAGETYLSSALGLLPSEEAQRCRETLQRLQTPTRWQFSIPQALSRMRVDKKARGGKIRFVLLKNIGQVERGENWTTEVPVEAVRECLKNIGGFS